MNCILPALLIILLFGCQAPEKNKSHQVNDEKIKRADLEEIQGVWGLTNYLDSIVEYKEIAKYRTQYPTWFCILVEVKGDSIRSFGSLKDIEGKLFTNLDTIFEFPFTESGKWILKKQNENLILKQSANQEYTDSLIYILRRRNDLEYMTKNLKRVHKIGNHITQYFNKTILSGKYRRLDNNALVHFSNNGILEGMKDFTHYEIRNYFGTYHPFQNRDVVALENEQSGEVNYFNWKFEKDKLILTDFTRDSTEYFYLGKRKIELKKIN